MREFRPFDSSAAQGHIALKQLVKQPVYTFGGVCLDPGARQVTRAGVPVHLTRKAFELLILLIERRPDVVGKAEIHRQLWPDTFVSESSIQVLISEIRHALDGAGSESVVRTVHGVGYAFVPDAREQFKPVRPPSPLRPRAWLLTATSRVALHDGVNVVGREGDDIIVIDAPGVSRRHARIFVGSTVSIEDLGSKNGTWLHGQRITGIATLHDGDQIRLGLMMFTFRQRREVESTETQAVDRG